jgi:hypothetical protein
MGQGNRRPSGWVAGILATVVTLLAVTLAGGFATRVPDPFVVAAGDALDLGLVEFTALSAEGDRRDEGVFVRVEGTCRNLADGIIWAERFTAAGAAFELIDPLTGARPAEIVFHFNEWSKKVQLADSWGLIAVNPILEALPCQLTGRFADPSGGGDAPPPPLAADTIRVWAYPVTEPENQFTRVQAADALALERTAREPFQVDLPVEWQ